MIKLKGQPVCGGIVCGELFMFPKREKHVNIYHVEDIDAEITRLNTAKNQAVKELDKLFEDANENLGHDGAMIFRIHRIMLEDEDYYGNIIGVIKQERINAEAAVQKTCTSFYEIFENMEDNYMRERGADVIDISERLIKILTGETAEKMTVKEPVIIAAHNLTPSQTVQMDKSKVLAFVTEKGSDNSHTAIIARSMHIPAITAVAELMNGGYGGKRTVIDGYSGEMYIEPDRETLEKLGV